MLESMVTTALTIPGYKVVENLGVVRGITVRSCSIVGNFLGVLQSFGGGNMSIYTKMSELARAGAFALMCQHADEMGADAIVAVHYDATSLMTSLTEVLCYGTAVRVEPDDSVN